MDFFDILKFGLPLIAAFLAILQYWSANAFKRAQYLSELWREFYTTEKFVEIFDCLERKDITKFNEIEEKYLFTYLAYLEEIVIFAKNSDLEIYKLPKKELINLFQFHFYYIYFQEETKKIFWSRIVENANDENIDKEIKSKYWSKQYKFAKKCDSKLKKPQ